MKGGLVLVLAALLAHRVMAAQTPAAQEGPAEAGRPTQDAALATFERVLEAEPDNLRAGSDYRQAVIAAGQYDRCIAFFDSLVAAHPQASAAWLNFGFAYVDKIPAAGAITQVILANNALTRFTKSLELKPTWIGYYTRGNSYLYWPKIFGRTKLAVADLGEAIKMQKAEPKRPYHVRTFVSLGDARWKLDEWDAAKGVWKEGLAQFPGTDALSRRLQASESALKAIMDETYDPNRRVATGLAELWDAK